MGDGNSVWRIGTHYETLGVGPDASQREIRDAYRALARKHHPDQSRDAGAMPAINEAYRVLGDRTRRSAYDDELRRWGSAARPASAARAATSATRPGAPPVDTAPARYPWKLVAGMAAVGAGVVITGAALYEPAAPDGPDNVLQRGSCVEVELNNDVHEVTCDGDDDLVVQTIVPFDSSCPAGLSAYRDRQGTGMACVAREPATAPADG
jgi:DnaJ-class molecular chaperone